MVVQKERVLDDLYKAILDTVVPSLQRAHSGSQDVLPDISFNTRDGILPASSMEPGDSKVGTSLN